MGSCPILLLKFHCLLYPTDQKLRESFTICPKLPFSPRPALPAPNLVTYSLTSPCLTSCILSECHAPAIPVNSHMSFLLIYKFPIFCLLMYLHFSGYSMTLAHCEIVLERERDSQVEEGSAQPCATCVAGLIPP